MAHLRSPLTTSSIDAHICHMIGISEHDFRFFVQVERKALRCYYREIVQAVGGVKRNAVGEFEVSMKEDVEARFLGDVSYVRMD